MKRIASMVALVVVLAGFASQAREIGFLEQFSLAPDRSVPLKQLIPGTQDYYYYHCLHYQNTEQFDQVEQTLKAWIKRYKYTAHVREILIRQALLTYDRHPEQSLEYIRQRLGIYFNHQRETIGEKPQLPTRLDPHLISRDKLYRRAISRHKNLQGFEDSALEWLVGEQLNPDRRRHLLERLQRPDYPQLPQLVVDDLNHKYSRGFGSFEIHRQLLLPQLEECLRLKPNLLNQTNFVNTYLTKLHPNADVDWQHDAPAREAYLERLGDFASRLAPAHNSLKAHVLYHRLVFDRSRGVYDRQRFMTYIRLPRHASYINPRYMKVNENRRYPANLQQDFRSVTLLPIVGNDEPLVRSYLHHFFVKETTYKPYERFINDVYLKHNFAETKIVNGLGEPEQWYSMLPPAKYQQLKERIDLDFAYTTKKVFAADDQVSLDLNVKNVETLIVKVFEINTQNYYRQHRREVNTDINLDGLVANQESTRTFSDPPLRRVLRHFEFPALTKPGVYVIDFIGNGKSSRAVVRKGKLRYIVRDGTAGHSFTVLDENNRRLPDATLWLDGHEYQANEDGTITTPFSNQPGRQPIILSRDGFSSLHFFEHRSEDYRLAAGIYVDRESLLTQRKSQLVVRPGLYLNGTPVTLSILKDIKLLIRSVDLDGVATTQEIGDFQLHEDRESSHEFQVPQRTSQLAITLSANVQNMSQHKKTNLAVTQVFALNEIDGSDKVEDLHLAKVAGNYVVHVLGKTGEPRPDRPVRFSFKHRDFRQPIPLNLQTDQYGRIALGALDGIDSLTATGPEGTSHTWQLGKDRHTYLQSVHGIAGEVIEIPYMGRDQDPLRSQLSLLELRGSTYVADRFDALSLRHGLVHVQGLPRGDYDLLLKESGTRIRLRFAEGVQRESHVLGDVRQLETRSDGPLQIDLLETDGELLTIQLRNATKFARVHVFATRYQPAYSAFAHLSRVRNMEPYHGQLPKLESLYVEGRDIGDEYRYIIDRQQAKKFPGNLLERPSLLLNPWAIRKTETGQQQAAPGEDFAAQPDQQLSRESRAEVRAPQPTGVSDFANLDFLYETSAVLLNLVPDQHGVISIDRKELGPHQHIHVVAVDPRCTVYRSLSLPEVQADVLDLRLARGMDPSDHFTQRKQISVVRAGDTFELADTTSSRFESYDSLASIYALFLTLSNDPKLAEFKFILDWHGMSEEQKRAKFSEFACHELSFFLYKKDAEFFTRVVEPYLVNKRDKTFLDRWLVHADLTDVLQPWNYSQLNIAERILLAQRIQGEQPYTRRHVQDLFNLTGPNIERFNQLFDTAIKGSSLEANDRFAGFGGGLGGVGGALEGNRTLHLRSELQLGFMPRLRGAAKAAAPASESAARNAEEDALAYKKKADSSEEKLAELSDLDRKSTRRGGQRDKAFFFGRESVLREQMRQFYRKLDKTQEWVENNYYKLPIEQQNADLITVNAFWTDYAYHVPGDQFFSTNLAEASRNFTEMMFALSLLDMPLAPHEHLTKFEKTKMTLTAASPLIVYYEQIRGTGDVAVQTPILVSQNFFRHGDRYQHVNNERQDKFVTDEFLVHTVYGCQVVVTNPTSSPQKLALLLQVPVGAMPVLRGKYTRSVNIDLQPFHTKTVEYHFYFPAAGQSPHYPVHVAKNEQLLAHAEPVVLNVVEEFSHIDRGSWDYISQFASDEQVLDYLRQNNLHRFKLDKIAFRMRDKRFFSTVIELLAQRHAYDHTLWSYGIRHNFPVAIAQYLQHADALVATCGSYIDSPLLVVDPVVRKTYQHMDYRPLVNARAHRLGSRQQILNDRFHAQYHRLLKVLSYRQWLDNDDLMSITYYLLLQGRVEDALEFFRMVRPDSLATRLQHDYFTAYLDFYSDDVSQARLIADRYVDYPVDRWRKAFANISSQLDEIVGQSVRVVDTDSRAQGQTGLAASEPNLELQVEARKVYLDYQNLDQVQVNYYLMDIELLFSRNPFVQHYAGQFSHIRPNQSQLIPLPQGKSSLVLDLPESMHNQNVLVEVIGGGHTKTRAYYANSMKLQLVENYGQLRVTGRDTGLPLPRVYVKAYARMQDGSVRFYKDGYTDLRGRFDYTSLNTNELDHVRRLSLLVFSDRHGAVVREANPPKR